MERELEILQKMPAVKLNISLGLILKIKSHIKKIK
jgi:hypothetical protein